MPHLMAMPAYCVSGESLVIGQMRVGRSATSPALPAGTGHPGRGSVVRSSHSACRRIDYCLPAVITAELSGRLPNPRGAVTPAWGTKSSLIAPRVARRSQSSHAAIQRHISFTPAE